MNARMQRLTKQLVDARRDNRQIERLAPELTPATTDEAYAVNRAVASELGWEPLGWKIAATTEAMIAKLGTGGPIYGRTFRKDVYRSPAVMPVRELLDPLIECEFFVTLGKALPARDEPWTMVDVIDAVSEVHAGIEVAECRLMNNPLPPMNAVLADGSASGRYVFGDQIRNWRDGLSQLGVVLEIDGVDKRTGAGADVMGDPLRPVLWLAEERRRWGDGLNAGETISTGSMTGMLPVRSARTVRAKFGTLSTVEVTFEHD